jgi:uncharacterized protein (TIGR00255 family)
VGIKCHLLENATVLKSMTGFARVASQDGAEFLQWEIRSVNHRYLDISFRMPEEFRAIEVKLRKLAGEFLARGKVECYLTFLSEEAGDYELKVNAGLVQALNKAQAEIQTITQQKATLSMGAPISGIHFDITYIGFCIRNGARKCC